MLGGGSTKIVPDEVFEHFDGPIIFTAWIGMFRLLFTKVDEKAASTDFVASIISDPVYDALMSDRLSLRGALGDDERVFIVTADPDWIVTKVIQANFNDVSADLLPEYGIGISDKYEDLPDILTSQDAWLGMYLRAARATSQGLRLAQIRRKLDQMSTIFRGLMIPTSLAKAQPNTFDYTVNRLAIGSLFVEIKDVVFKGSVVGRYEAYRNTSLDDLPDAVVRDAHAGRDAFVESISDLAEAIEDADQPALRINKELLGELNALLGAEGELDHLVISTGGNRQVFSFTASVVSQVLSNIQDGNIRLRVDKGRVTSIDIFRHSILMYSRRGREVRCVFSRELFDSLRENRNFDFNSRVTLRGELTEREKRDLMNVESVEDVEAPPS